MFLRASFICSCLSVCLTFGISAEWSYEGATITLAHLNVTYVDLQSGTTRTEDRKVGKFGSGAVGSTSGLILVGRPREGSAEERSGCTLPWASSPPSNEPWVALVARGDCSDMDKVENALALNASGVIIYARDAQAHLQKIALSSFSREHTIVVFLAHEQGEHLARMVENGTKVYISITRGQDVKFRVTNINRTSVLFVSVSFIILMVISLAWLVFYYIQRFRYIHAKDRLARHLCNAAKKALSKIPVKNLKSGDKEVTAENECCAICIEPYQISETIRILPCKHQFHKYCVDPWLLEHRTCPMCKMDILKFYGYVLSDSEESVLQLDVGEDTSGAETETHAPTPPPPPPASSNPRNTSISQVMVAPLPEAVNTDVSCEGWLESPVPDTPISPVHQPTSAAASSMLRSVIDSAKTRVNHSGRVSHSSHTAPSSAKSHDSQAAVSALPEIDGCTAEQRPLDACIHLQDSTDTLEIASVCSDDFADSQSIEDVMGLSFITSGVADTSEEKSAISRLALTSCDESALDTQQSPLVPNSTDAKPSSKTGFSRKDATLQPRSTARSRSLSRRRSSGHRTRSTSKRRSASHARSTSRGRSASRQSPSSHSESVSRSARKSSRPSSHIINVSHV